MSYALMTVILLAGDVSVEVTLRDDTTRMGQLVSLSAEKTELVAGGESITLAANEIRQVSLNPVVATTDAMAIQVNLTDGSSFTTSKIHSDGTNFTLSRLESADPWVLNRSKIGSARLIDLSENASTRWQEFVSAKTTSDVVVITRRDKPLQSVEGIFGKLSDESLQFQFDGEWIDVKRSRVAGLVFFASTNETPMAPRCRLDMTTKGSFQVHAIRFLDNDFQITTSNGTELRLPASSVATINFSSTSTVYLSDIEPERWRVSSQIRIPSLTALEDQWLEPRSDRTIAGGVLKSQSEGTTTTYSKGLGIHSGTELVYRTAGEFTRFQALASIDDIARPGKVTLVVVADGNELFKQTITRENAVLVDVNLVGTNRLAIRVEPADDSDLGDHLSLCNARMIK